MSSHAYTEDHLVEQPAIELFAELGWQVAGPPPNAGVAGEPRDAGLLGRETKDEVVLVSRLRTALERFNPVLPPEAITAAVDELTRDQLPDHDYAIIMRKMGDDSRRLTTAYWVEYGHERRKLRRKYERRLVT